MNIPLNIDWQQILLHLLNFVILAGGLYFLLYKPVKNFMNKRTSYYEAMDAEAKAKVPSAQKLEEEYKTRLTNAEEEIREKKASAVKEAEKAADAVIAEAKAKGNKIISDAQTAAKQEKDKILQDANAEIEAMVSSAIDKVLVSAKENSFDDFLDSVQEE